MSDSLRARRAPSLRASVLAPVLLLAAAASGCGDLASADQAILIAPTVTPISTPPPAAAPLELAAVFVIDTSTSANRFAGEALDLFADLLDSWPAPGRGGVEVYLNIISSTSYDAASTLLAGSLAGLPPAPTHRTPMTRPELPSFETCQENAFSRAKCEAELTTQFNTALAIALADEEAADEEFRKVSASFDDVVEKRLSEAASLGQSVRAVELPVDPFGTDVAGALLRASEQLHTSRAPRKLIILWSDLAPYGRQQPGTFDLAGIELVVILDCAQGTDCTAHREDTTAGFLDLGAVSVRWLDPATARMAGLLGAVR